MVTTEQLQTIVNNFIAKTLEQDLLSRAEGGQGSAKTNFVPDSTKALAERHILTDEIEAIDNGLAEGNYNLAKRILEINDEPTDEPLLNYYMMLAYKAVTEEAVARANQEIPNNPEAIAKTVLKNFQNQTQPTNNSLPVKVVPEAVVTLEDAIEQYFDYYKQKNLLSNPATINNMKSTLTLYKDFTGAATDIKKITLTDLNDFKFFMSNKPTASKAKYKGLSPQEILEISNEIPVEDIISSKTQREGLMKINQFFNYCEDIGFLVNNPCKRLIVPDKNSGVTRAIFTEQDKENIFKWFETLDDRKYLYYVLAYTGMRISEVYTCKVEFDKESGIYYFSLLDAVVTKTQSSRRCIPLCTKLLELGIVDKFERIRTKYKKENLGFLFNDNLENVIEDSENKVCYSFRHTVATELLNKFPEQHLVISRLLGHSHKDDNLTTKNYFKGFGLEKLKKLVDSLC